MSDPCARYRFIGHALRGDGPFRPVVSENGDGSAVLSSRSYIDRYSRESDSKYARRNQVAFFDSPLAQACSRFVGYLSTKPAVRDPRAHDLYARMAEDIDGRGNSIEIFWQLFLTDAKARGAGLLLVDMPAQLSSSLGLQIAERQAPYWTTILPESLTAWRVGDDGKFAFAEFNGKFTSGDEQQDCIWHFDAQGWHAKSTDSKKTVLAQGEHPCGECPVLIWAETGEFPGFGPFSSIADLSKRLFNLESELDEILRSQTFSILNMPMKEATADQRLIAAQTAGTTIGTQNLLVSPEAASFIAPPSGPAEVYMKRIDALRARIDVIGLNVAAINQQESGIAMTMRFQQVNAELTQCAVRTEDLERRAWDLSAKWLKMSGVPEVSWSRDYQIADVTQELQILADMQATAMPPEVITAQRHKIVSAQFGASDQGKLDELSAAIDEAANGIEGESAEGLPADRNAEAREGLLKLVSNGA